MQRLRASKLQNPLRTEHGASRGCYLPFLPQLLWLKRAPHPTACPACGAQAPEEDWGGLWLGCRRNAVSLPLSGESKHQRDFLLVSVQSSPPPQGPPTLASGASSHVSDNGIGRRT